MTKGRVVLIGAVHESLDALRAIAEHPDVNLVCVVTLSEEAAVGVSGVVDLASEADLLGVPVVRVDDVNATSSVAQIRRYAPDVIAVVGWTRLIRDELLDLPTRGCIGFHASLLPKHRGRAPVNWSIIKGEPVTGNTMMLLNAGVDTGLIIDQRSTPIEHDDTCGTVYERVAALGAQMLKDNLGPLIDGTITAKPQDESAADVLPKRIPAMGVTDWLRSSSEIHDWIRAQAHPYPGAYTHLGDRRIHLWSSLPPPREGTGHVSGVPGEVIDISSAGLRVATGDGSLVLTVLGEDPCCRMQPDEWAMYNNITIGDRFEIPPRDLVAWSLGEGPKPTAGTL